MLDEYFLNNLIMRATNNKAKINAMSGDVENDEQPDGVYGDVWI